MRNKIQVTTEYKDAVQEYFTFVKRGLVAVKGKGELETYFLERKILNDLGELNEEEDSETVVL